jgi:hypothetical protein
MNFLSEGCRECHGSKKANGKDRSGGKRPTSAEMAKRYAATGEKANTAEKWSNKFVAHSWASSMDKFSGYGDRGKEYPYVIPADELHLLIRGFLKLLGVNVIVPLVDLAIFIGEKFSPDDDPDVTDDGVVGTGACSAQDVIFQRMLLVYNPALGKTSTKGVISRLRRGE